MRAAVITTLGGPPSLTSLEDPGDTPSMHMLAVALSPVDLAVASGRFAAGHPPLPYVVGHEGVGQTTSGLVYVAGGGIGITRDGLAAETRVVPSECTIPISDTADPAVAAALGTAGVAGWNSVTLRGKATAGDTVVVRGASGAAGRVALQAAREAGATKVIALGRSGPRLEDVAPLCDATVVDDDSVTAALAEAAGGPVDLLVDFVWGEHAARVLPAMRPDGRVVVAGGAGGIRAEVPSSMMLARRLDLLGYSNFGLDPDTFARTLRDLVDRTATGSLSFPVTTVDLADVAEAWEGTRASTAKYAIAIQGGRSA